MDTAKINASSGLEHSPAAFGASSGEAAASYEGRGHRRRPPNKRRRRRFGGYSSTNDGSSSCSGDSWKESSRRSPNFGYEFPREDNSSHRYTN